MIQVTMAGALRTRHGHLTAMQDQERSEATCKQKGTVRVVAKASMWTGLRLKSKSKK